MSLDFRLHPETLREIVDDPAALDGRIAALASSGVADSADFEIRCEYVSLLRIAGRLDEAALEGEMNLASADLAGDLRKMAKAMMILGHVRQWRAEWELADACFQRATRLALFLGDDPLIAFAAQHSGKNFFDQRDFVEAALRFRLALELRQKIGAPAAQVEASRTALAAAVDQL